MRLILVILGAAFILAACGTAAQVESQQGVPPIVVNLFPSTSECHVEAEATDDAVLFTASSECGGQQHFLFTIEAEWGTIYDGGVKSGNQSTWHARPGAFEIRQAGEPIGLIAVPK